MPAAQMVTLHIETAPPPGTTDPGDATVRGGSESFSVNRGVSVSRDVSEYAGQNVDVEFVPTEIGRIYYTRDSDGDGFPDSVEAATYGSVRLPKGTGTDAQFHLDPTSADTDGDGLDDDEEVSLSWAYDGSQVSVSVLGGTSNPAQADTDGDDLDDYTEVNAIKSEPWTGDTDGDGIADGADARPTEPSAGDESDAQTQLSRSDGNPTTAFKNGLVWGDWGYEHKYEGHNTAAYIFGWILPYLVIAAGYVPVIEDALEIALEVRECVAINDALWENLLDCGFAVWEIGTSAAKILGSVGALVGLGAAVAGAALAADEVADVGRAVSVFTSAVRKVPNEVVERVGRLVAQHFDSGMLEISRRVADNLPGAKATKLLEGAAEGKLIDAGVSDDVASRVAETVIQRADDGARIDRITTVEEIAKRIDDLDDLQPAKQANVLEDLAAHDEGLRLADNLGADTLWVASRQSAFDSVNELLT